MLNTTYNPQRFFFTFKTIIMIQWFINATTVPALKAGAHFWSHLIERVGQSLL